MSLTANYRKLEGMSKPLKLNVTDQKLLRQLELERDPTWKGEFASLWWRAVEGK
jgi:hypothetical protein